MFSAHLLMINVITFLLIISGAQYVLAEQPDGAGEDEIEILNSYFTDPGQDQDEDPEAYCPIEASDAYCPVETPVKYCPVEDSEDYGPVEDSQNYGPVDVTHEYLSTGVENISQKIDSFFGEKRIYEEATESYLQIRGSTIYSRGGEIDFKGRFRAKVDLPQLRKKAHLVFESDSKDDREDYAHISTDELVNTDTSASVQFFLKEKKRWDLTLRPGLRLSNPIETFIKLRFRRGQALGATWFSRSTIEVGYYSDDGWENEWSLDLERPLGERNFFRSTSTVLWREEEPGTQTLGQKFLLTHKIDSKRLLAFEVGTTAKTRPNLHDDTYFSTLRYRRDIYRGWVFFEVKPQVVFEREEHFKADPSIAMTLEVLLGARFIDAKRREKYLEKGVQ